MNEISDFEKIKQQNKKRRVTIYAKKKFINWSWCVRVLFLTLALSIMFSILSELALTSASLIVSLLVIVVLMVIGIFFDCIGVATTSCDEKVFEDYERNGVKGAKQSLILVCNAEKVSVICCDIIGDVCGILCGASGVAIVARLIGEGANQTLSVLVSALVSGLIAGITIFGKSLEKGFAVKNSEKILLSAGRCLSLIFR